MGDDQSTFTPPRLLCHPHLMTIAAAFWRRRFPALPPAVSRIFQTELARSEASGGVCVRGECHWQPQPQTRPTLVLLHGLEGSSDSGYMLGAAERAWLAGFTVVRLNQRNCGGTDGLSSSLYHSGLSGDLRAVIRELIERDGITEIFAAGFSMGGNLVLKMAAEMGSDAPPQVKGFAAVAPALDLAACAAALAAARNFIYEGHFVRRLKRRMRLKARLFPEIYARDGTLRALRRVRTVREFDDVMTAPFCGFANADDYYARSSAGPRLAAIARPTFILASRDDPVVPISSLEIPALRENPHIAFLATPHGGHCAFISRDPAVRFWAEARIVEFCRRQSDRG